MPPASAYRTEIDGLRATAVLAVLFFHANIPGFSGGFVGVDIFLVLSGYLIAGLILREADAGRFSLIGFYERRVRRILPALLTMLAVTALLGWVLLPNDFRRLGASLAWIAAMASNFFFARSGGYFAGPPDAVPLLHTWTLAVEEQFYAVFPLVLLLARRRGRHGVRIVLAAAALLSLGCSIWLLRHESPLAFYSPASRAWEFLAGAMLAADMLPLPKRRAVGDPVALAGLALIGWAIWRFDADTPFPGLNAILPVLGSALVLAGTCAEGSRVARALSFRPLAGIGLISYSLYLWHWPLIVFGGYYVLDPPTLAIVKPAMALLAIPVAWASWRFIELPFRKPRLLMTRRRLFIGAAAVSVALALYGVAIHRLDGVPGRFSPIVRRLSAAQPAPDYGCAGRPIATLLDEPRCRMGDPARPPDFIIWGDSHTAVYLRALDELARRHGESGVLVATLGCVPLDTSGLRGARAKACRARNAEALDWISRVRPRAVVLGGNWTLFEAGVAGRRGVRISVHLGPEYEAAIERQAVRLRALGVAVYFVLDVPQSPSPIELAKARVLGARALSGSFTAEYLRANARTRALAFDLQRRGLLRVIDPGALLCGPWTCRNVEGDAPLYHDRSHLNAAGARLAAPAFEPMFAAAALPPEPR